MPSILSLGAEAAPSPPPNAVVLVPSEILILITKSVGDPSTTTNSESAPAEAAATNATPLGNIGLSTLSPTKVSYIFSSSEAR